MRNRRRKLTQAKRRLIKGLYYIFPASKPRKLLFDHLPKCGGSSLSGYLGTIYPKRKTFSIDGQASARSIAEFKALPERKRHGYDLVQGHLAHELLDFVHPDSLKVTIFREPVDRVISHYYFAKSNPKHYLYQRIHEAGLSLDEYVTSGLSIELRNWYTAHFAGLTSDEAERNPKEALARAMQVVLRRYDVVGFLEDFRSFAERLRREANFIYAYEDKRVNVNLSRPDIGEVAQSSIRKIEECNRLDIALYQGLREKIG